MFSRTLAAIVLPAVLLVGCGGPSLGTVTGTVTIDGKPAPNVTVTFVPEAGGRASTGVTDSEGKYELLYSVDKGALIGKHKVALQTNREAQGEAGVDEDMESDSDDYEKLASGETNMYKQDEANWKEPIPAKYNTETTLSVEVKSGANVHDFAIETK